MTGLLGPNGKPISTSDFRPQMKKAAPPKLGEAFGDWAGRDIQILQLPGGGIIQFDLSKLVLEDFRSMRDHYQVNASLAVLSFMQHQSDWHIECEDKKIADLCETNLRSVWTALNRSLSTANWAGYSPNALDWESDFETRSIRINKVKDLRPESCEVNWKEIKLWAPPGRVAPKAKIYDGIKYIGSPWPIPVENSFWYPLLMEEGDYYGRKLLRPAFTSWFFSILVHLFANRYYERFGEPTPVGRAPFDEELDVDNQRVKGNQYLLNILSQLRSRSAVVLPNDQSPVGTGTTTAYDYDIEYLESQMRGADFERYMTRLDEEISIGLFTPILLMRTADVGSYNLGVGHMQIYLWMLNAMNDDRKVYIDKYILRKMVNYNFSEKAPSARIVFRKLGNTDQEMIRTVVSALISKDKAQPDLDELGTMAGMTLKEVRQTTAPDSDTGETDDGTTQETAGEGVQGDNPAGGGETARTAKEIVARIRPQVEKAMRDGQFGSDLRLSMGFKKRFQRSLETDGVPNASTRTDIFYDTMDHALKDLLSIGPEFTNADSFMSMAETIVKNQVKEIVK